MLTRHLPLAFLLLASAADAQADDLQPGRNFPNIVEAFGTGRSAEVDLGDIDLDGDLDVLVGNGMDGSAQANRIFVNQGGLQGGIEGGFVDETALRLAGAPNEQTRDVEFADIDQDGDLDFLDVTDASNASGGAVSRFYENQGPLPSGPIGHFVDISQFAWGQLVSVPAGDQVFGGNVGPWRGHGWDGDFADLDLDGDLDLFWATPGPLPFGARPSLVFMNDGTGVFDELWPWADPAADVTNFTMDADLADLDGDFDIDIFVSGRETISRVYVNNLNQPLGPTPFQDITQAALVDTDSDHATSTCYEVELFDADADGDFDAWMTNYFMTQDRMLENQGPDGAGGLSFLEQTAWITPLEQAWGKEHDVIDYDGDGDPDIFGANFVGPVSIHRNTLAQDGTPTFAQTDTPGEAPELPVGESTYTAGDVDVADLDGDGDPDAAVARETNSPNRYYENVLGIPDSHAPTFAQVESAPDVPLGQGARVIAQVRDNAPWYVVAMYPARLFYSFSGGIEFELDMVPQGGQQFMSSIPGGTAGLVSYRVEVTDRAGNVGVSATQTYVQGGSLPWSDLGFGLAGTSGTPSFVGTGTLAPGSPGSLVLSNAAPSALSNLFVSTTATPTAFKGGQLVPVPAVLTLVTLTDVAGTITLSWGAWPGGLPAGTELFLQMGIVDAGAVHGVALSPALRGVTP